MRGAFWKKAYTIFRQNRVYSSCRRLCSRTGKYMEIPLFGSRIRRRHLYFLYIICHHIWLFTYDCRSCSGTQNRERRCRYLSIFGQTLYIYGLAYHAGSHSNTAILQCYGRLGNALWHAVFNGSRRQNSRNRFFSVFSANPLWPVFWLCIFVAISCIIVMFGVKKGIERTSKIFLLY